MTKLALAAAALAVGASLAIPLSISAAERPAPAAEAADAAGTVEGLVTAVDAKGIVTVQDGKGASARYLPRWIGGMPKDGGGFEPAMAAQLKALAVGDRVRIEWRFEEHRRALAVTVLERAKPADGDRVEPDPREGLGGGITGRVTAVADGRLTIETERGAQTYVPRWIGGVPKDGGGFDRAVLERLAALKVGDQVRVRWIFEERLRVLEVEVVKP